MTYSNNIPDTEASELKTGTLYPYHKREEIYWCKNDKRGYGHAMGEGKRHFSYTWSAICQRWDWSSQGTIYVTDHGENLSRFKNPSGALTLIEENTDEAIWPWINDGQFANYDFSDNRHLNRALVAYVDGHTNTIKSGLVWMEHSTPKDIFGIH